uniref:Mediator of RNA polymerase II transcription subunit 13 n=1 Tax=Heterorhabditis bacteriophora TaxID=37862 RepID=A0A1I7XI53_HETBA
MSMSTFTATRLNSCLSGCDFILKWKGKGERDRRTESDLRSDLQSLWNANISPTTPFSSSLLRGLEVLLVLEAKTVYENKMDGAKDLDWFTCNNPVTIMNHLEQQLPINEVVSFLYFLCSFVIIFHKSLQVMVFKINTKQLITLFNTSHYCLFFMLNVNKPLQVLWRLLTRCCDVSIELIDVTSSYMPSVRFGTSPKVLTWLKHSAHPPQPLFYVPDN